MVSLLALPSGALVVSQFQDPVPSRPAFRFECSNLLLAVLKCLRQNLVVSRGSVEISRESVEVRRESVEVSRESVEVSRESVEVSTESQ